MKRVIFVFFAVLLFCGCGGDDISSNGPDFAVVELDPAVLEEALEGYSAVPAGQVAAAVIAGVEAARADRLAVTVESHLERNDLEVLVEFFADSRALASQTATLPAGSVKHVYADLPITIMDEREITVSMTPFKPAGLPESDAGLRFLRREFVFRAPDLLKIRRVDFAGDVDGDLSKWEGMAYERLDAGELGDLSARLFYGWDEEYFYIAAAVNDGEHFNLNSGSGIWNGDALQFAFDVPGDVEAFNLGLALASGSVQTHKWFGSETGLLEHSRYIVLRDEDHKKTYYEAALPINRLAIEPAAGAVFGFGAVIFDDDDGKGQDYWVEMSPGITGGWNPRALKRVILWD